MLYAYCNASLAMRPLRLLKSSQLIRRWGERAVRVTNRGACDPVHGAVPNPPSSSQHEQSSRFRPYVTPSTYRRFIIQFPTNLQ
jgi:hypothetical protein